MNSTFKDNMLLISKAKTLDDSLVKSINDISSMTRNELLKNARENEHFKNFLELQYAVSKSSDAYLKDSSIAFEDFKELIRNHTSSGFQRFASKISFGLYKNDIDPEMMANLILDLYRAQSEHKNAVNTSFNLLKNRRELIYSSVKDATTELTTNAKNYSGYKILLDRVVGLKNVLDNYVESGKLDLDTLKVNLSLCTDSGLYDGRELLARISSGHSLKSDLYLVKNDIDRLAIETEDKTRDAGLVIRSVSSIIQGLDLQKDQYQAVINGTAAQLSQLETDLRYTKITAQTILMLAQNQSLNGNNSDGFLNYKDVINQTQLFNSLGARVMLDRVGFLLTTPFFEQKKVDDAREELSDAVDLFKKNEDKFQNAVTVYTQQSGLKTESPSGTSVEYGMVKK